MSGTFRPWLDAQWSTIQALGSSDEAWREAVRNSYRLSDVEMDEWCQALQENKDAPTRTLIAYLFSVSASNGGPASPTPDEFRRLIDNDAN